jgi:tetratricopeptide (TPR) repeat protein
MAAGEANATSTSKKAPGPAWGAKRLKKGRLPLVWVLLYGLFSSLGAGGEEIAAQTRKTEAPAASLKISNPTPQLSSVTAQAANNNESSGVAWQRLFISGCERLNRARTKDDFRAAAQELALIAGDGCECGYVFWNLGDAWQGAGEYGKALAAYRQARRLLPREPHLAANLDAALQAAPGRLPDVPPAWWRKVFFWQDWLAYHEKYYLAAFIWTLTFVFGVFRLLYRRSRSWQIAAWAGVFAGVVFSLSAGLAWLETKRTVHGAIIRECTARKGADEGRPAAFDRPLADGAEFILLERRGRWLLCRFGETDEGWVPEDCVITY